MPSKSSYDNELSINARATKTAMLDRSLYGTPNRSIFKRVTKAVLAQAQLNPIKPHPFIIRNGVAVCALSFAVLNCIVPLANSDTQTQASDLIDIVTSVRGIGDGSVKSSSASNCKVTDGTDVIIYVGEGTTGTTQMWAEALIDFWKTGRRHKEDTAPLNDTKTIWVGEPSLNYVTLTLAEFNSCNAASLAKASLFLMPGGNAYELQRNLGSSGKTKLTQFLDQGGNYVGICAGGYYATAGYYWKADDGVPAENCADKFCRYGIDGTYSFDSNTQNFTRQEWNGVSYHSNLLGYGPLANTFLEGPVEEIAGPWSSKSDPNPPYDSHQISGIHVNGGGPTPPLRTIYWGGATENYIYTKSTESSAASTEWAHYIQDTKNNDDLYFPQDGSLWALKRVTTNAGGTIMLTSAHFEASLFHIEPPFTNGGLTECQQYNNYTFMTQHMAAILGWPDAPDYDLNCSVERGGEVKQTQLLFPAGLAHKNAPRAVTNTSAQGSVDMSL